MWIGLSGFARAGKDTIADQLVAEHDFNSVALAVPLKEMVYELNPWVTDSAGELMRYQDFVDEVGLHEAKDNPEVRRLLQVFGTEVMRQRFGEDVWVDLCFAGKATEENWVITDCRYHNEAEAVKQRGGYIVRVERPGVEPPNLHPSETAMLDYDFDYILDNDGTLEDIPAKVREMLDTLG